MGPGGTFGGRKRPSALPDRVNVCWSPRPEEPASIGVLPLTVAREAGCRVACLPGLATRRVADLYPGEVSAGLWKPSSTACRRRTLFLRA